MVRRPAEGLSERRAGTPGSTGGRSGQRVSRRLDESVLLDAYSETRGPGPRRWACPMAPDAVRRVRRPAPTTWSTAASSRPRAAARIDHNGQVQIGWSAPRLLPTCSRPSSTSCSAPGRSLLATSPPLSAGNFDETGSTFVDSQAARATLGDGGQAVGGARPAARRRWQVDQRPGQRDQSPPTTSDWQVPSWTVEAYFQPRSIPERGTNRHLLARTAACQSPAGCIWSSTTTAAPGASARISETRSGCRHRDLRHVRDRGRHCRPWHGSRRSLHLRRSAKTANVYLNRDLLAARTDQNFAGLQSNAAPISIGCRTGAPGFEQDGILDRVTFGAGVMTAAEIAARPAPETIADPDAPGAIMAVG